MDATEGALLCCALAAAAAMAARPLTGRDTLFMLIGFAAVTGASLWRAPSAGLMGCVIAGGAGWLLTGARGGALVAGVCAGLAVALALRIGVTVWVALPCALIVPLLSQWLSRTRPGFAPARMTDEALCGILLAALLLAAVPAMESGWRDALALNRELTESPDATSGAAWVWCAAAASLAAGIFGGWLKRR